MTKSNSISYFKYASLFLYVVLLTVVFRAVEIWSVLSYFSLENYIQPVLEEGIGLLGDIGAIVLFFLVIHFFEWLFRVRRINFELLYLSFFLLLFLIYALLLKYFIAQSDPLGEILFQQKWDEVIFTVQSAGYDLSNVLMVLIGAFVVLFGLFLLIRKKVKLRKTYFLKGSGLLTVAVFLVSIFYISEENYATNKMSYFISKSVNFLSTEDPLKNLQYSKDKVLKFQEAFPKDYVNPDFPFLHHPDTVNYLDEYFNDFDTLPNIVLLLIEGLNDDFIHKEDGVVLMPFLSQLKDSSLYWKRCFTLGERSFAVVPSSLGGLPYGKISFAELKNYPNFLSLVSVLKRNDYQVSNNEGQAAWFLSKKRFFMEQGADYVFDMDSFPESSKKIKVNDYFWGYDDKTLFNQVLKYKDKHPKTPYFDVYFSGTMHSPYRISDQSAYEHRYDKLVNQVSNKQKKSVLQTNEKYYITTLFTDDALKDFFAAYSKRPEYNNTIFFITGDHPMTEVPRKNALKRYHVPLIMYSPKLKTPAVSNNVVSHLDIYQTVLNLTRPTGIVTPKLSSSLGDVLKVEGNNKDRKFVFMEGDRRIQDIYSNGYYLAGSQLYEVQDDWSITQIENKKAKEHLQNELTQFKYANLLSTFHDRLFPLDKKLKFFKKNEVLHKKQDTLFTSKDLYISLAATDIDKVDDYQVKTTVDYKHFSDDVSIVVSLTSKEGASLFWQNYLLKPPSDKVTFRVNIPVSETQEDAHLSVLIWNKREKEVKLNSTEVLIINNE